MVGNPVFPSSEGLRPDKPAMLKACESQDWMEEQAAAALKLGGAPPLASIGRMKWTGVRRGSRAGSEAAARFLGSPAPPSSVHSTINLCCRRQRRRVMLSLSTSTSRAATACCTSSSSSRWLLHFSYSVLPSRYLAENATFHTPSTDRRLGLLSRTRLCCATTSMAEKAKRSNFPATRRHGKCTHFRTCANSLSASILPPRFGVPQTVS